MKAISHAWLIGIYWFSWLVFGLVGLGLNAVCAFLMLWPGRERRAPGVRRMIKVLFELWVKWLHMSRVVRVDWHGFERPLEPGTIFIANHPCLIDATVLLSRLPNAVCIFKPALMKHPAIGPAAIMAGYVSGGAGVDSIREVSARVIDGASLLIFPEGTRTAPGTVLGKLRPGFALIAGRAKAPVQLITLRATPGLLERGRPWWKLPSALPAKIEVTLDQRWSHSGQVTSLEMVELVRARLLEALSP